MASDSQLELETSIDADSLRLEQLKLEAKVARLEAEAKALEAKLTEKKQAASKPTPKPPEAKKPEPNPPQSAPPQARKEPPPPRPAAEKPKAQKPTAQKPTAQKPAEAEPAKKIVPTPPVAEKVNGSAAPTKPAQAKPESKPVEQQPAVRKAAPEQPIVEPEPKPGGALPTVVDLPKAAAPSEQGNEGDGEGEEPAAEESGRGYFSRLIASTPSYMISAIFHLVALLILAMIMLPMPEQVTQLVVEATALEEQEEIDDVLIESLEEQLEPIELEEPIMAHAIEVADPGAADLGAIAQDVPNEVSTFGVAMNDTDIDAIGSLFGNEGEGMADSLEGAGGAEFFGVKASGRKFVFIVDSSLSMKNGKFEGACEELMYAVSRLSKDQYFYVLFFDHDAARMTFDGKAEPEDRAVPATSTNINKLGQWVRTVELELRTDPYDCVEFAMKLLPDAIYILTDGKFTDKGKTVRYLKNENLYEDPIDGTKPKVVIHTVGFYQRDGEPTLIPLAKMHGGTYRFVPKPGKR